MNQHKKMFEAADACATIRRITPVLTVAVVLILSGCANNSSNFGIEATGLKCIDDSPKCIDRRQAALRAMLSDPQRVWVQRTPSAEAYASGVRLFAFKKTKKSLTCPELGVGIREASGARASLRSASARLSPAQIARGAMLGDEVARELTREKKRRCKKG